VRKLEEKLERVMRENEERWKERDERMKVVENRLENEESRKGREERRSTDQSRNLEKEGLESEMNNVKERVLALEDSIREGEKPPGKKDREAYVRIDEIEKGMVKDRAERQEFE
jgi:hypothetical protein